MVAPAAAQSQHRVGQSTLAALPFDTVIGKPIQSACLPQPRDLLVAWWTLACGSSVAKTVGRVLDVAGDVKAGRCDGRDRSRIRRQVGVAFQGLSGGSNKVIHRGGGGGGIDPGNCF